MSYREAWIDRDGHRMYARDYPVQEPPIVLMHGFPDNVHLYDRLVGPLSARPSLPQAVPSPDLFLIPAPALLHGALHSYVWL